MFIDKAQINKHDAMTHNQLTQKSCNELLYPRIGKKTVVVVVAVRELLVFWS